ncbi:hypothetical protein RJT34_16329 [Clitoria ternatea]|uniref:Uncharacterized protein n=1 Tax=Clitoria ternatea TaxID=43366 RepID=A0AAN9PC79_CLITE
MASWQRKVVLKRVVKKRKLLDVDENPIMVDLSSLRYLSGYEYHTLKECDNWDEDVKDDDASVLPYGHHLCASSLKATMVGNLCFDVIKGGCRRNIIQDLKKKVWGDSNSGMANEDVEIIGART